MTDTVLTHRRCNSTNLICSGRTANQAAATTVEEANEMGSGDFLCKEEQTPLIESYVMAGVPGSIASNSEHILAAARGCFGAVQTPPYEPKLHLRFWVDPKASTQPPWPKPYFRGLDHLIYGAFDPQSSVLMDVRRLQAIGRFSPVMAADHAYWQTVVFPSVVTVLGAAAGVTPLHCACVVRNEAGLVLAGLSGAGKSTLSFALARNGFDFLSEDWTYFSRRDGELVAWGLPTQVKLLPDAASFFAELRDSQPVVTLNGEWAYLVDLASEAGRPRRRFCQPRWVLFLERKELPLFRLSRMGSSEAAARLERDLLAQSPDAERLQRTAVAALAECECWRLEFGGPPWATASALMYFCDFGEAAGIPAARERQ
ncbi:MAG: hypothetical protein ACLQVL_36890 [Terriglobia bacterium]